MADELNMNFSLAIPRDPLQEPLRVLAIAPTKQLIAYDAKLYSEIRHMCYCIPNTGL